MKVSFIIFFPGSRKYDFFPQKFSEIWTTSGSQQTESQNWEELRVDLVIKLQKSWQKIQNLLAPVFFKMGVFWGRPDQINFYRFYILVFPGGKPFKKKKKKEKKNY